MGQIYSKDNEHKKINKIKRENFRNIRKKLEKESNKKSKPQVIEAFDDCYKKSKNIKNEK